MFMQCISPKLRARADWRVNYVTVDISCRLEPVSGDRSSYRFVAEARSSNTVIGTIPPRVNCSGNRNDCVHSEKTLSQRDGAKARSIIVCNGPEALGVESSPLAYSLAEKQTGVELHSLNNERQSMSLFIGL